MSLVLTAAVAAYLSLLWLVVAAYAATYINRRKWLVISAR